MLSWYLSEIEPFPAKIGPWGKWKKNKYIISTTFKPIEVFIVAGGVYLLFTFFISNLIQFLENRYKY